jgi:tRNA(Ile)-lysidine synthase
MASSKKSPRRDLRAHVAGVLAKTLKPKHHLVLGLSGGIDSMVLLDILKAVSKKLRFNLSAVHVNHQLSPHATSWAKFCERHCRAYDVPLRVVKVNVSGASKIGLEAAARQVRYRVYGEQEADRIVLAHHLDDQAETILLQLLRGSGIKGLSAMPEFREYHKLNLMRPLLDVPRTDIERYAKSRNLKWVEDESNDNTRLDRNFLRHEVLPVIEKHFPAYRETLSRVCRHFADASNLLDQLGAFDWSALSRNGRLQAAALRKLTPARARNLLRFWLAQNNVAMPSAKRLDEILQQVILARRDANLRVAFGEWEVRRFKGAVYVCRSQAAVDSALTIAWHGESRLAIAELGGTLSFRREKGKGIAYAKLIKKPVSIRVRQGGEKLHLDSKQSRRSLKNLLQESAIPPWERLRLPLLYSGERLVFVPCIGIDSDYQAKPGEAGLSVKWDYN